MEIVREKKIFKLIGKIDENSNFGELANCKEEVIFIDMAGVIKVNSVGLSKFLIILEDWLETEQKFVYQNIPEVFAHQMDMIGGLVSPFARIENFLINLKCDNCGHSFQKSFTLEDLIQANGLQITKFYMLVLIRRQGETRLTELAKALGVSKPSATTQVKALLEEGLIRIKQNKDDARSRRILLTAKGEKFLDANLVDYYNCQNELFKNLTKKEKKTLVELLGKLF